MSSEVAIRQLTPDDRASLAFLIDHAEHFHRHLDWRMPVDWLGMQPFIALTRQRRLLAALACPDDASGIGWIRFFAFFNWDPPHLEECWARLFEEVQKQVGGRRPYTFVGLGLQDWFVDLLRGSGFVHRQDIVVLEWLGPMPPVRQVTAEMIIRPMQFEDLRQVAEIDHLAFDPFWRHTHSELELALHQSTYATVATAQDGTMIGYQASTGTLFQGHLARLAVHPDRQRESIGYALVRDMLVHFEGRDINHITVNTQSDNASSLALYQKMGFRRTGEDFPVYIFPLQN